MGFIQPRTFYEQDVQRLQLEYLECICDLTNFVKANIKESENVLIGTDSSCSKKSTQRRKSAFSNLAQELDLVKASANHPTFHHHNGSSESNIDCFLISRTFASKMSLPTSICTLDTPENFSSHEPVLAKLQLHVSHPTAARSDYSHTYTAFTQQRVIWDTAKLDNYQHTAAKALSDYDKMFPLAEHIPLKCELFSSILVKAAELCMEVKPANTTPRKKKKPSAVLHNAWLRLRKAFNAWKAGGKQKSQGNSSFVKYKQERGLFQRRYRYEAELSHIKDNNTIMQADYKNRNGLFNLIKSMRSGKLAQYPTLLNTPSGTYHGMDTLEGFTADAELLGQAVTEAPEYDNKFYKLCKLDNCFIFEFKGDDTVRIPEMKFEDLEYILDKDMKLGKACDIYRLTVEHLRFTGHSAKLVILKLLNDIISNIYYQTCTQVKKGLSTSVYKGKKKPIAESSSYRRITVTPQIGSIIDRYIDPMAEDIFLKSQSPDQLGFTKKISYLMAAVERGECQRYALDKKQTCFGVSFDGKAAFPSVDRDIQVRELYTCGETGDLLQYSNNTYKNTVSQVKQNGMLGRQFSEYKGTRQGDKRAAGHFKSYIKPCLLAANFSELGFWIGAICVTCVCVADDTYVLSGDPRQLQGAIDIVAHYGRRYRVIFGADKTKVTVTGSKVDMLYYKDINMWSLDGNPLPVTDDNEHLGLIVSGLDEEIKNIDKNIDSARQILFNLLGNIFSYKCKLSATVILHVWSIYVNPVLRSGLAALPIRPTTMKTIIGFHHKILRGILKLSPVSPLPPLYFLLGELPMEASLHLDILALFWSIWANPQTKVHEILKYLLMMCDSASLTWSAHIRLLFQQYSLPDPLTLLSSQPWSKERWRVLTKTAVTAFHEVALREKAAGNSKLNFLNVQTIGLTGRPHPVLSGVLTTREVPHLRIHIKMLSGDYPCYSYLGSDRNNDA